LTDKLPATSQADELAALVDAQDSVQKSTPDNYQNDMQSYACITVSWIALQ
jgi:hypothetical protein